MVEGYEKILRTSPNDVWVSKFLFNSNLGIYMSFDTEPKLEFALGDIGNYTAIFEPGHSTHFPRNLYRGNCLHVRLGSSCSGNFFYSTDYVTLGSVNNSNIFLAGDYSIIGNNNSINIIQSSNSTFGQANIYNNITTTAARAILGDSNSNNVVGGGNNIIQTLNSGNFIFKVVNSYFGFNVTNNKLLCGGSANRFEFSISGNNFYSDPSYLTDQDYMLIFNVFDNCHKNTFGNGTTVRNCKFSQFEDNNWNVPNNTTIRAIYDSEFKRVFRNTMNYNMTSCKVWYMRDCKTLPTYSVDNVDIFLLFDKTLGNLQAWGWSGTKRTYKSPTDDKTWLEYRESNGSVGRIELI